MNCYDKLEASFLTYTSFTIELSSCNQSFDFNHTLIAHIYDRFFENGFDMLLVCILVIIVLSEDISATKRNFMVLRNLFIKRFSLVFRNPDWNPDLHVFLIFAG